MHCVLLHASPPQQQQQQQHFIRSQKCNIKSCNGQSGKQNSQDSVKDLPPQYIQNLMKNRIHTQKALGETQTLRAGHRPTVTRSQKISPRRRPLSRGAGRPKFNQLEMVTTFIYRPSLVKIDARNFDLSW